LIQKTYLKLAKAESFYLLEVQMLEFDAGGGAKWLFSYPSYLSTRILQWKKIQNYYEHTTTILAYNGVQENDGVFY
jgi:hypothetical protein